MIPPTSRSPPTADRFGSVPDLVVALSAPLGGHPHGATTMQINDTKIRTYDPVERQADCEDAAQDVAVSAMIAGPKECGRATADVGYAFQEAVRVMAQNRRARPAIRKALVEHCRQLAELAKSWSELPE